MRKDLKFILLVVLSLLMFTACSGSDEKNGSTNTDATVSEETKKESEEIDEGNKESTNSSEKNIVIRMLVPGYDSGYMKDNLDPIIARYKEMNPETDIQVISAGWDELNSKIVQLFQAGDSPDILLMGSKSLKQFSDLGVIENLDDYLSDEYINERVEAVFDTGKVDDTQYAVPFGLSTRALYYRSDLIENPPTNWDELLEIAKKVNEEHDIYGFAIPTDITHGTPELLNFFYQNEGRMMDEEGNFTVNSSSNIETLEYLSEFKDIIPDPVSLARVDQKDLFMNGDLAMFIDIPTHMNLETTAEEYPFGVVMLPSGKVEACTLVTDSFAISAISENKEESWKFIEYMTTGDQQIELTYEGWVPVINKQYEEPMYSEELMKPFVDILPNGIPEPSVPNYDEFNKSFLIAVQKVLTGEIGAKEALDQAQEECQATVK